ncbi:MAG: hypothetical protein Q4B15_03260 [Lachnospiraceae bacterium]|nr:hypothetical protein [Lachnospiraceae bacterium]
MPDELYELLGLVKESVPEASQKQIEAIYNIVQRRLIGKLTVLLGEEILTVPDELSSIVLEVCVNRYNRVGSEGAGSHTVEGESYSWANEDYFAPYEEDIEDYVNAKKSTLSTGRLRFL